MKHLTIIDVAALANVSISTVSRVINKHPDVSRKTREKVEAVIKDNVYVPNNSARDLKRESLKAIAVIVKGISNTFFGSMIPVLQQKLEENGYAMLIHQLDENDDEVRSAISICKDKKPRGLIFMGGNFTHSAEKLAMIDAPFVMLTITLLENINRKTFSSVTIDDYAAGFEAGEKAHMAGHTNVAAIAARHDDESISRLRIKGFTDALEKNNVRIEQDSISYASAYSYAAGYDCAKQLLAKSKFTCLFCVSDTMAIGAMRAIHDNGLSVPKDISVIGFDGLEVGQYSTPSLATLKQPGEKMAKKSVGILLKHLRTGSPHEHHLFKTSFVNGESFAAVAK